MDCEVRVVSFIGEERGDTGSLARSVVVGELSQRKQFGPVVLLVAAVGVEVLLEGLIDPLGLTIPFRMISRGEVEFHVERCAEAAEKMRDKLRAAVRCGKLLDKIHRDGIPGTRGNGKRFEESIGFMPTRLDSAADCARVAIVFYEGPHTRPYIISTNQFDSLVLTVMARERMIVLETQDSKS